MQLFKHHTTILFIYILPLLLFSSEVGASDQEVQSLINTEHDDFSTLLDKADYHDLSSVLSLEKAAIKEKNYLYLACASYAKTEYYIAYFNIDSIEHYAQKGLNELELYREKQGSSDTKKIENELRTELLLQQVKAYIYSDKFDLSLVTLKSLLDKDDPSLKKYDYLLNLLLGHSYVYTNKGVEALESYRQAYVCFQASTLPKKPYEFYTYFEGMLNSLLLLKDYNEMLLVSDSVIKLLDKEHAERQNEDIYNYYLSMFQAVTKHGAAYTELGNYPKAREELDKAKQLLPFIKEENPNIFVYRNAEAVYFYRTKDYATSKKYLYPLIEELNLEQYPYFYLELSVLLTMILHEEGNQSEAYTKLQRLYELKDSITANDFSKQVAELQMIYQVNELRQESTKDKLELKHTRTILLTLLLFTILLGLAFYFFWRNAKEIKEKNRKLFKQYSEIEKRNVIIQTLETKEKADIEEDNTDKLIAKLEAYLIESGVYRDPELTREKLAVEMGTNRQYLIEAIKEKKGMTYNEYIYSFRLKYAYDTIVAEPTKTISEISVDSGFTTRGTFNRVFKEKFGITPKELRDMATE